MAEIKFYNRAPVPMEMHKVKIVQKLTELNGYMTTDTLSVA